MILLLDALSVRYFQYSYDPAQLKHTGLIIKRLNSLYSANFLRDIIVQIDSVVILNLGNIKLNKDLIKEWTTDPLPKRINKSKFFKTAKKFNKLLQNSIVLNYDDLGLAPSDLAEQNLIDEKFRNIWISPLKKIIKDSEVILVGEWTTIYSLLLSEHLQKIKLYRRFFNLNSIEYFKPVEDKKKYVEFYNKFYGNRDSKKKYFPKSFVRYKKFIENPFSGIYLNQSDYNYYFEKKDPSFSKKAEVNKIIFVGNKTFIERYLYQNFKDSYYWYDCSENSFKIKPKMDGLIFTSVHKLTPANLRELLSEISTGKYKRKPVFLLADELISISPSNDFIIEPKPTSEECRKYFCHFFHEMIYEKLSIQYYQSQEFDSVYMDLCNSDSLSSFFNGIISLSELELFLNKMQLDSDSKTKLLHLDFWYDFINYYESKFELVDKSGEKVINQVIQNEVKEKPEYWIQFTLDLKSDIWWIENNMQVLLDKISYSNSKGLGYMEHLVNECRYPKTISAKDMIRLINESYPKKTKKADYINPPQSIRASIRYDLNKIAPKILHLIKQFQLEEECSYAPNTYYDIKFITEKGSNKKEQL